jgi:hypothetical protein
MRFDPSHHCVTTRFDPGSMGKPAIVAAGAATEHRCCDSSPPQCCSDRRWRVERQMPVGAERCDRCWSTSNATCNQTNIVNAELVAAGMDHRTNDSCGHRVARINHRTNSRVDHACC